MANIEPSLAEMIAALYLDTPVKHSRNLAAWHARAMEQVMLGRCSSSRQILNLMDKFEALLGDLK